MCFCPRIRRVGCKAAVLVLVWVSFVSASLISLLHSNAKFSDLRYSTTAVSILTACVIIASLCAPFAGLVATVYFGRWKVICTSFWLMWSGVIGTTIVEVLLELVRDLPQVLIYVVVLTSLVAFVLGFITFAVNSVPFGLDQMPDASSQQITAFIHWYIWSVLAGAAASSTFLHAIGLCAHPLVNIRLLYPLMSAFLLTLALCTLFLFRRWLIIEPESKNPLYISYKVLKFTAKHKVPVRRSAFTYWEPGIPSRIDLGKSKYGGPFTTEEVENTKTCLNMLLIFVAINVTISSFAACLFSVPKLHVMVIYQDVCQTALSRLAVAVILCVLLSLPVYDTLTFAASTKCVLSTLQKAGLSQALSVCPNLIALGTSVAWYISTSPDQCMLALTSGLLPLSLDYRAIHVPLWIINTSTAFSFFTAMLEFLCAQAPYNLRGLLVGLFQSTILLSLLFGGILLGAWTIGYRQNAPDDSMCGIWFYLFTTTTEILGCVIWCVVAKWYKKRERDEPEICRIFAENYYDH